MRLKILLVDEHAELKSLYIDYSEKYSIVICLFWLAPSTKVNIQLATQATVYGLQDLIGDHAKWEEHAYQRVLDVVHDGPTYRELPWRSYLTERLYNESLQIELIIQIVEMLRKIQQQTPESTLIVEGKLNNLFSEIFESLLSSQDGISFKRIIAEQADATLLQILNKRLREVRWTGGWKNLRNDIISWLDNTYKWRLWFRAWMPRPPISQHTSVFFSSYSNNSKTLAKFLAYFPPPINWSLANNSAKLASLEDDNITILAQFSGKRLSQSRNDTLQSKDKVTEIWLSNSPTWADWQDVEFELLVNLTSCWETYLDEARPPLIVMANQWGIEGWFTSIAKQRGIPVIQLMHGILSGYLYTQTPIISDLLVVWGEFWRELWAQDERDKIIIFNPQQDAHTFQKVTKSDTKTITFFSWPLNQIAYYHETAFWDGFIQLFSELLTRGNVKVIIRFHPLENPNDLAARWKVKHGTMPSQILLSKQEPLSDILMSTDIAIMFRSTVMLDCIANNIPIIMPGWINFGWNDMLDNLQGIYLAEDWLQLAKKLNDWLDITPIIPRHLAQNFLSLSDENATTFQEHITSIIQPKVQSGVLIEDSG